MISTEELEQLNEQFNMLPLETQKLVSYINYLEYQLAVDESLLSRLKIKG